MKSKAVELTTEQLIERQTPGWLVPYLAQADMTDLDVPAEVVAPGKHKGVPFHYEAPRRWVWWMDACEVGRIPETPIPKITFENQPDRNDAKAIQTILRPYLEKGLGGYDDAWMMLVRWILYGLGYQPEEMHIERIPEDIRAGWYQQFNIFNLLHSPCDWSAFVMQRGLPDDNGSARYTGSGFYSTPMPVCHMMTEMMFGEPTHDQKYQSVLDPACGTGSMLLPASNHSLRLFGQDIVYDLCLCAILNGYLWVPWMVAMPDYMREILEAGKPQQAGLPVGIGYATDPEEIERVTRLREAARRGELVQMPML